MANHPPYCVVLTYLEDRQEFALQTIDRAMLEPVMAGKFAVPIPLETQDFKIDDEFAHGLGATMLNMIALGQPDIKQYMTLTPPPGQ
ncbi:hypothetical protein LMG28614_04672 [Paraburkholderia ultramafica]|jgi:hypothetical protein|uniref:Uncharacterized protein n=2 Tax=Paraburkholderia TaxID=1822464 RepID=A0A6S7CUB0_9BURK|nr:MULTISPECIES: hypothetical protein [Paraburkholderia]QQC65894.1 hypothetical protein I6I06_24165 [Paraburkholderia ginsengisoli]CAB3797900.1 hypothetical protein LMG28614_04672 [Paraburkholderia ultramafica]